MIKIKSFILCFMFIVLSSFIKINNSSWLILSSSVISFSGSGAEGTFKNLTGIIKFDPNDLKSSEINVSIDANTIETGSNLKNKHAKNDDWLDVKKYPKIYIRSKTIKKTDVGFLLDANLELHGVIKTIQIPFRFISTLNNGTFNGEFKINRKDYDISGPFYGFAVGDEIIIKLSVQVKRN